MKFKIIVLLAYYSFFSSCTQEKNKIIGNWIAINSFEKQMPITYDFKSDYVYTIDNGGKLYKQKWQLYKNQLIVQDKGSVYKRYAISFRGSDSLLLTGTYSQIILVSERAFFKKHRPVLTTEYINDALIDTSWEIELLKSTSEESSNRIKKIEFLNDSILLAYAYNQITQQYAFAGIMKWSSVCNSEFSMIQTDGVFSDNFFISTFSDSEISANLVANIITTKDLSYSNMVKMKRLVGDSSSHNNLRNILIGKWRNTDSKLDTPRYIPDSLIFVEESGDLLMMNHNKSQALNVFSPVSINNTAEFLITNDLKNGMDDLVYIMAFSKDTIKLEFHNLDNRFTFLKYK